MSVPIILKTGIFTLLLALVFIVVLYFMNALAFLTQALLILVIFFLVLDVFEREATRLGKKV